MHSIQCRCGCFTGSISGSGITNRVICYCSDCRAFAYYLQGKNTITDAQGGTEILQLDQSRFVIHKGKDKLIAMRLSPKGLIRWYTSCCHTPIGNTLANHKMGFIGLIHCILDEPNVAKDFGSQVALVNVEGALEEPKPKQSGLYRSLVRVLAIILKARLTGSYRSTSLFSTDGKPIVTPKVLTVRQVHSLKTEPAIE